MPTESDPEDHELYNPELYLNRDLSWLAFNDRVLDQARDPTWPVLERVKFLAIFGSNLDEFFMIRVSGLHEQLESQAQAQHSARWLVCGRTATQNSRTRQPSDTDRGLAVAERTLARARQKRDPSAELRGTLECTKRLGARVFPARRVPRADAARVDPVHPFPFLSNLSLSLAVEAENPTTLERRFARIKVPESLPRFVLIAAPSDDATGRLDACDYVALEELIAGNLADLFPGVNVRRLLPVPSHARHGFSISSKTKPRLAGDHRSRAPQATFRRRGAARALTRSSAADP